MPGSLLSVETCTAEFEPCMSDGPSAEFSSAEPSALQLSHTEQSKRGILGQGYDKGTLHAELDVA